MFLKQESFQNETLLHQLRISSLQHIYSKGNTLSDFLDLATATMFSHLSQQKPPTMLSSNKTNELKYSSIPKLLGIMNQYFVNIPVPDPQGRKKPVTYVLGKMTVLTMALFLYSLLLLQ